MLKIGILSDSHRKVDLTNDAIELLKNEKADYLVHAGDFEIKENLDLLKNSGVTYVSVFGNNDYNLVKYSQEYNINQEPYYFSIKQNKFKLMHIPNYMSPDSDIIIFGHTHIFEHQYTNDTLYLNPGEICAREQDKTQCVILNISDSEYIIEYFYKKPNEKQWNKETIQYERK